MGQHRTQKGLALLAVWGWIVVASSAGAQESALDGLKAASKGAPGDASAALSYGRALRLAGRVDEAAAELRRASQLPSKKSDDLGIAIRWEQARTAIAKREFKQAMAFCKQLGAQPGGSVPGHACAAEAHLLWRRASEALVETGQALANGSKSYEAKVAEGLAAELELREGDAEKSFREAISWKPDAPEAHLALGRMLVHLGRKDDGVAELKRALALDGKNPEAHFETARALGSVPEALTLLRRAVSERPNYTAALLELTSMELNFGHLGEARKTAESLIRYEPKEPGAHIAMGRVLLAEKKPDDAIKAANTALALLPNSAPARLLVADAYTVKKDIDFAVENYEAAYGLDHGDPTPLVRASEACLALGRPTSAKAFGRKATEEFPKWGPAYVALGDALSSEGTIDGAVTAYEAALKAEGPLDQAKVRAKLEALRKKK